ATSCGLTLVFSSYAYLDVSVQRVRLPPSGMACLQHAGLPHSEIHGSNRICRYPWLIAAYHVLHRLWEPRHPPCALIYFLLRIRLLPVCGCLRQPMPNSIDSLCCPLSLFLFSLPI